MCPENHKLRYWLLLKPDVSAARDGVKQMHRLAGAFLKLGRHATLIQYEASFYPGWFYSEVNTMSEADWLRSSDL